MKKKRHLTPYEIKEQYKAIAKEKRMADRSPWSAMSIICPYVVLKSEGFKGKRISKLISKITEYEEEWLQGNVNLDDYREKLKLKAEWTLEFNQWTEADITARKGSYRYWLDKVQLDPQNQINKNAERYMLFFFAALIEEYGYGKERLTRVEEYMNRLLLDYQENKTSIREWKETLLKEAGIVVEMPVDPLTQTSGSIMTG